MLIMADVTEPGPRLRAKVHSRSLRFKVALPLVKHAHPFRGVDVCAHRIPLTTRCPSCAVFTLQEGVADYRVTGGGASLTRRRRLNSFRSRAMTSDHSADDCWRGITLRSAGVIAKNCSIVTLVWPMKAILRHPEAR